MNHNLCMIDSGLLRGYCISLLPDHKVFLDNNIILGEFSRCMLCFVVLNVAVAKKNLSESNQFFGLAIGLVIVAGAYGAGAVSGGCFNPAVAFGIDISSIFLGFGWSFLYIFFELVGAALAVFLFKLVRPEDFNAEKSPMTELMSEFLGTFMLVLTVGLNVLGGSKAGATGVSPVILDNVRC